MVKQKLEKLNQLIEEFKVKRIDPANQSFIEVKANYYTLNNGQMQKREQIFKGGKDGSAAIIIPYVGEEILLVIEPRVITKSGVGIGFPAGYLEDYESPEEAALRELREETGLVPESIEEIDSFYQDEGCSSALNHIFIAYNCKKLYKQKLDKDEIVKYELYTEQDVYDLEEMGYIMGCNSKLGIARLRSRNEKIQRGKNQK